MKNTKKYILISLAVLLLLGGGFVLLYITDDSANVDYTEDEEIVDTTEETTYLIDKTYQEIDYVEISGPSGDYVIVQVEELEEAEDEDAEDTYVYSYYIEGYEEYDVSTAMSSSMTSLTYLIPNKELGVIEDLEQYGLSDADSTTVTMYFDDGTVEEIAIGIEAASTYGNYINYNGEVYIGYINDFVITDIVSNVNVYTYTIDYLYDDTGTAITTAFEYLTISGTNYAQPIEIVPDSTTYSGYSMTSPVESDGHPSTISELATLMQTFTTDSVVAVEVTEEQLADYGLDEPFATIEFSLNGVEHKISVSEKNGTNRYVIIDDVTNIVYSIAATSVSSWAENTALELRTAYVNLTAITDLQYISFESDEVEFTVELEEYVNEEESTDDAIVYDYNAYFKGNQIDYDDNVTAIYYSFLDISVLSLDELAHETTATASLVFEYYDGEQVTIDYYKSTENDDRYVAYVDGEFNGVVRNTSIESLITAAVEFDETNS
ncbi:MAG: DUF4340 domain-containing protein [Clostridia bacterium]